MTGGANDEQPLLQSGPARLEKSPSRLGPGRSVVRRQSRQSASFKNLQSSPSRSSTGYPDAPESSVAFTVLIKRDGSEAADTQPDEDNTLVQVTHEAVTGAVQDVCGQAVQEAVQDAFQQALDENIRFDVRANFFTLIAITGVILFWRGIWSLWDKVFGFSIWSELGSIATGLVIMITFRLIGVPLLDGLPSG